MMDLPKLKNVDFALGKRTALARMRLGLESFPQIRRRRDLKIADAAVLPVIADPF